VNKENIKAFLLETINKILKKKGSKPIETLDEGVSLRNDLGFDSLDLAELTVRIEDETGIDIFEKGIVDKISEIMERIGVNE
jgi:acyl carrier protein